MINLYRVVDNLISLAKNKYIQLEEIYKLTCQQTIAIEEADMEKLLELIDKKQEKIDLAVELDKQFESIADDIKTIYDGKSIDELELKDTNVATLKDTVFNVTELLKAIIEIENSNKKRINDVKDRLETKMKKTKTGKTALRQYNGMSSYADAVFFDRKIK